MAEPAEQLPPVQNNTETTTGGITGAGFQPGRSGNPGGRPKGLASASREVLRLAVDAGEDPALALARFWASVVGDEAAKMEHRLQAADRLADRGWGKPPQYAPIEDDDPLGMSAREEAEIADSFNARLDEVAARRRAREESAAAEQA